MKKKHRPLLVRKSMLTPNSLHRIQSHLIKGDSNKKKTKTGAESTSQVKKMRFGEIKNKDHQLQQFRLCKIVIKSRRSLMYMVRPLGLSYCKKNIKDLNPLEKYYARLSLNSIVDIYDNKYMQLLNLNDEAINDLKERFRRAPITIPAPNAILVEAYEKAKDMILGERHVYFTKKQFKYNNDDRTKMNMMSIIYKVLSNDNSILTRWRSASEWSLIVKLWSNIFENLFEDTTIELIWGDTKNDVLKVDLRLCLKYQEKLYDLSNIEFKKNGTETGLIRADKANVLGEAKAILNKKSEYCNMSFEEASNAGVVVGQICGLKLVFTELMLVDPGSYVPGKYGRTIRFPHDAKAAETFSESSLEQLFVFKRMIIKQSTELKEELQKGNSQFGAQSTVEDQSFTKSSYIIPDKAIKWPAINEDYFKS